MSDRTYTVKIGELIFNKDSTPGKEYGSGRPNPSRVEWTLDNRIVEHNIPYPMDRTCLTSTLTLWHLTIDFDFMEKTEIDKLIQMSMNAGPYWVETAHLSRSMYIKKVTLTQIGGQEDTDQKVTINLTEARD